MIKMKRIYWLGLVLVVGMIVLGTTLWLMRNSGFTSDIKPVAPIQTSLYLSGIPSLNNTVELSLITTLLPDGISLLKNENTKIQIYLPDAFVFVNGNLTWTGKFNEKKTIELKALVKPVKTGDWEIFGTAGIILSDGSGSFGDADVLFIHVSNTTGIVSKSTIY